MQPPPGDMRVGVAWYTEAEWHQLRHIAADPEELEPTYADWKRVAEAALRHLAAAGVLPEPIDVSVAALQAWCRQQGRPIDGDARAAFASELLRRRYEGATSEGGA
jgi:hypothetical protein